MCRATARSSLGRNCVGVIFSAHACSRVFCEVSYDMMTFMNLIPHIPCIPTTKAPLT